MPEWSILSVALRGEQDVVLARQRARQIATLLGFDPQDQVRIATAVSEIARNAQRYAREGRVEFVVTDSPPELVVKVSDSGAGIADLDAVLAGRYRSTTGMGIGIVGASRLMDRFDIKSSAAAGTRVVMRKDLPRAAARPSASGVEALTRGLARERPRSAVEEVQAQNQELLTSLEQQRRAFEQLHERQVEVERLNRELEETNRGVLALYAEIDEKAEQLRRASDHKTRFLSHMSHEFRTPLGSLRSISRLLLDRLDGPLTPEQEKQVRFIQSAAEELSGMVDDLLDLAKIEAGRLEVSLDWVEPSELVGSLRGMFRPLTTEGGAELLLPEPHDIPAIHTDERKVAQILRNFISNAIKFTRGGYVRLLVSHDPAADTVSFTVEDTGIGIPEDKQAAIFDEFAQVDSPLQRQVHGTGLGLPVSRRLASLLGGRITLESEPGRGSAFTLTLPIRPAAAGVAEPREAQHV